jgi:alcohol dehydrogenase
MLDFFRMADVFMFQLPRKIIFGNGAAKKIGEEAAAAFAGRRVFLVTDRGVVEAGLADPVIDSLRESGFEVVVFDEAAPDSPISLVLKGSELARKEAADIVLGIGGGSSIDMAKAISFMVTYHGDIRDCLGINQVKGAGLPKVFVPTTAGTGSELSHTFVLLDDDNGEKITSYSPYTFADLAIIDPTLTLSLPPVITAESGIDAFSHALESFVTIRANPLSDLFARRGIEIISRHIRKAYAKGAHNLEARYAMCFGVCMGTMAIRSSGIGAVHASSYPVAVKCRLTHGAAIALMMPSVMAFNLISNMEKYASVAEAMGERVEDLSTMEAAQTSVEAVRHLIKDLCLPGKLRDVGASQEDFPEFARVVLKRYGHHLANNPRNITEEDLIQIYEAAW